MRIYRNGVIEAEKLGAAPSFTPGAFDLYLGAGSAGRYFAGEIDEFRMWKVARSESQIRNNINAQLLGSEPGLVAYYRMDEGGGTTSLLDSAAGAQHGTLVNNPQRVESTVPECGLATFVFPTIDLKYYEGYQVAGINQFATDSLSYFGTDTNVRNLCADIAPVSGIAGVSLTHDWAKHDLRLSYDDQNWAIRTTGDEAAGIRVRNRGARGSNGGEGTLITDGGPGASGGTAMEAAIDTLGEVLTAGHDAPGIVAISQGGNGGNGGDGGSTGGNGGWGGNGGDGGNSTVTGEGLITTAGVNSIGVRAISKGGQGGNGGEGSFTGIGGRGGIGGDGGLVTVNGSWDIVTSLTNAYGIGARSLGGAGGSAGSGGWISGDGGDGGGSGDGSMVAVNYQPGPVIGPYGSEGTIETAGAEAHGIFAQSIGGFAGSGGSGDSIFSAAGGSGGSAGSGGDVSVTIADSTASPTSAQITTTGEAANAVFAQSVGGGGGSGGSGSGLFDGGGGNSSAGGNGGQVTVDNAGELETSGYYARGLFAQSVGGSGGNGASDSGAFYSIGAAGGRGGDGNIVGATNRGTITTGNNDATGLFAQSIGGGGGNGGGAVSAGIFGSGTIGGRGGPGGNAAAVTATNTANGTITTGGGATGDRSHGIFAQSVGGGGGNGGFALSGSGGAFAGSVGIGGNGATGGDGSSVAATNQGAIGTDGVNAHGIFAQSVGGGGGSGGYSIAISGGLGGAAALSLGGKGGSGGNAGTVNTTTTGMITTAGDRSYGVLAQSVGGGGGDGGFSISGSVAGGAAGSLGLGGNGGGGGTGSAVQVHAAGSGQIATTGKDSHGVVAQSIGGGGGTGGYSVSGGISGGAQAGVAMGGDGGSGSAAGNVTVTTDNQFTVTTGGEHSYGILAQSVGGGGGDAGFAVAGGISGGVALNLTQGGAGGAGGLGGNVVVNAAGTVSTSMKDSHGIVAQSVGGGGGMGGFSVAGGISSSAAVSASLGGTGGTGADAGMVNVNTTHAGTGITTSEDHSYGVLAQSVGGGGGDGGFSIAGGIGGTAAANFSIGGAGGVGGNGNTVTLNNMTGITTAGQESHGLFAQSVGGGGGSGGLAVSAGAVPWGGASLSVSIGGEGESGGTGGSVSVGNSGALTTTGQRAHGVVAQSIGGGGGNGGSSFAGSVAGPGAKSINLGVGGGGGGGGAAGGVAVENSGMIDTGNAESHGILAQSIGGGGGNGGSAVALALSGTGPTDAYNVNVSASFGGGAGDGGAGDSAMVTNNSNIVTRGESSHGIFAQSVGGGGGSGGTSLAITAGWDNTPNSNLVDVALAVGGGGGNGNHGGTVDVVNNGNIETLELASYGIQAQSVGGGGGVGGSARALTVQVNPKDWLPNKNYFDGLLKTWNVAVGGSGGGASDGGLATVTNVGNIVTRGYDAHGIMVQSTGGGGGVGGAAAHGIPLTFLGEEGSTAADIILEATPLKGFNAMQIVLGGSGGSSGNGGNAVVDNTGTISTEKDGAHGILAQSVGGGGGIGGAGAVGLVGKVGIGGSAGTSGNGGNVTVSQSGEVSTDGLEANGITAQSIGGGGGIGGSVKGGILDYDISAGLTYANGGGNAGDGGAVTIDSGGDVTTTGSTSYGVFAQSVGGGGGVAGGIGISRGFAGSTGGSGKAGAVRVTHADNITTHGDRSDGIFAQSAGGTDNRGGTVDVTVGGQVLADGLDSNGIFAQSSGGIGGDNVTVTVQENASVQGGTGSAAAVRIDGGAINTLTNRGTISGGVSGFAIRGGGGNESVDNHGTVSGPVELGTGNNAFHNHAGGTFETVGTVGLGTGMVLTNEGLLTGGATITGNVANWGGIAPGTAGAGELTIDGNLTALAAAVFSFDLGGIQQGTDYDLVRVTNSVQLTGNLVIDLLNSFSPSSTTTFTIMEFGTGSGEFANAPSGTRVTTSDNRYSGEVTYTETTVELSDFQLVTEPPINLSVKSDPSGGMTLRVTAPPAGAIIIEYSSNLRSDSWDRVLFPAWTTLPGGDLEWVDDGTLTGGIPERRFYRVDMAEAP